MINEGFYGPETIKPAEPRNFRRGQMYSTLEGNLDFYIQHPRSRFSMKNELFPRMEEVRAEARYDDPTFRAGATISFQRKRIEEGFLLSTL